MMELNWMQQYAADEMVEHAAEGRQSRREMMTRLVAICGPPALAAAFLAACSSSSPAQKHIYDGAGHAFNNDTGTGYVEAVAVPAWQATLAWFARYLV